MNIFRKLSPEEEVEFRQWARKNYEAFSTINIAWHPIIVKECAEINYQQYLRYVKEEIEE